MPLFSVLLLSFCGLAAAQSAPPHPWFDSDQVHTIRLQFGGADWYDELRRNFEGKADPDYAEVNVTVNDVPFDRAGIRFKGNSSYNSYPGRKKSFKIKLNKYVKGQKYEGLETFNLNNAFKDPSFVREKAYYELAAAMGLAAPRVSYAAVYINDVYWGLYFLTEQVDKTLLQGRFGENEDGNLFKGDPRGTLEYRGPDPAPYRQMFELETNETADDWSDLIELARVLNTTPPTDLPGAIEPMLDVDAILSLLALDNFTVNLDSYIGSGHNYYLYHRQSDGRFTPVPWDPNEAWGVFNMNIPLDALARLSPLYPQVAAQPAPGLTLGPNQPQPAPRPLATRLFAVPEYRQRYLEKLRLLAEGVGHPDLVAARMNLLRDMIRPYVQEDRMKMFTDQQFENAMAADIGGGGPGVPGAGQPPIPGGLIPGLEKFMRARLDGLLHQLPE
jgi:hypothetical protein